MSYAGYELSRKTVHMAPIRRPDTDPSQGVLYVLLSDEISRVLLRVQQITTMKVVSTYSTLKLSLRCFIIQSYLRKFGFPNPKKVSNLPKPSLNIPYQSFNKSNLLVKI